MSSTTTTQRRDDNSTTESRAAVDVVGRLAANAREYKNVKYKKLAILASCISVLVFSRRAYGAPSTAAAKPTDAARREMQFAR